MSQLEIDRVLAQIRAIQKTTSGSPAATDAVGSTPSASFGTLLRQGIDQVNAQQSKASEMATKFERGVRGVELPQVMIEMQKSSVSLRALTEVRNRFVEAYREIMNMPL
jgi:flagellar hook-basal body complex protein FliE